MEEADDLLELPISKIIFEGPESKLNLTENTQPAIFFNKVMRILRWQKNLDLILIKQNLLQDIH